LQLSQDAPEATAGSNRSDGHRLGYEMSQRELSWHGQAPPAAPYDMPPGGVPPGLAGARGAPSSSRCPALDDDEAVAQALQDEYDREHSNLRQHATRGQTAQQTAPDYRQAGYQNPSASSMPSMVPASCNMCQGVTPIPYAPGRLQFRCERCGFLQTCTIPRSRNSFGDDLYYDRMGMPLICNIQ